GQSERANAKRVSAEASSSTATVHAIGRDPSNGVHGGYGNYRGIKSPGRCYEAGRYRYRQRWQASARPEVLRRRGCHPRTKYFRRGVRDLFGLAKPCSPKPWQEEMPVSRHLLYLAKIAQS